MGKTIAAVFLRLPAVSVKGFLSWLLLSALLLQLSEPVSDALPFRRLAAALLFSLFSLAFYESEEGQREFAEWKAEQSEKENSDHKQKSA